MFDCVIILMIFIVLSSCDHTDSYLTSGWVILMAGRHTASVSALIRTAGDAEGANEMTYSMGFLRQFCRSFQQNAAATRIFFPDKQVWRQAA